MSAGLVPEALDAVAADLFERHLARAKEWFPHEMVPWGQSQHAAEGDDGVPKPLPPGAASALWAGLLTEDNLPHYYAAISTAFDADSALGAWARRWTAEEQRHSIVIRDWVHATRCLDPVALERARMAQVSTGFRAGDRARTMIDGLVYLTLQELATRIAHWNTGAMLDGSGRAVLRRVAADENLHFLFYRDLTSAAIAADPSAAVIAIDRQVRDFEMPGTGLTDFAVHATAIAAAGVYDFGIHYEQVLAPVVVTHWRLEQLEGLSPEAEEARTRCIRHMERLRRVAERMRAQGLLTSPVGQPASGGD